jgi:hypothetical protein
VTDLDDRDVRAADLRLAGVPLTDIRKQLGFADRGEVIAALARARESADAALTPAEVRDLELARLDRLQMVVWQKAMKGDDAAQSRVLDLTRLRLALVGPRDDGDMVAMFDASIAALRLEDADQALVAAGRRIAAKIDAASSTGDAMSETKALYLVPHLMNVLRELGATPAAREALAKRSGGSKEATGGKLASLRAVRANEGATGTGKKRSA